MSEPTPTLVVVLGMHRSGTSISTRGLACLGVELGEQLMPGGGDENPTGYFEDVEIHALSERVLDAVGTTWDGLELLPDAAFETPGVRALRSEAVSLLRQRLAVHPVYGFKNPRTARLLRFWQPVFEQVGADVRWICVLRNPLSVARSLAVRDGFDPAKSLLLWLSHMLEAAETAASGRATCLDYDALLAAPSEVIERIGHDLELGPLDRDALADFERELLDPTLRHTRFEPEDLRVDPAVTTLVRSCYELLRACARGEARLDEPASRRALGRIRRGLRELAPLLAWTDAQDRAIASKASALELAARQNAEALAHRETIISHRDRMIADRDAAIERLNLQVVERQQEIDRQREIVAERDAQIVHLRYEAGTQRSGFIEAQRRVENVWELHQQFRLDHARDLEALHARLAEAQARAEADAERLRDELAEAEARAERARDVLAAEHAAQLAGHVAHVAELQRQLTESHARQNELHLEAQRMHALLVDEHAAGEALHRQLELERQHGIDWFHAEAARIANELVDASRGLGRTRAWRASRRIQHAVDRVRRRRSLDATLHLEHLMLELLARAQRRDMDARVLFDLTRLVDETTRRMLDGRIFRIVRGATAMGSRLRRTAGGLGPVETLQRETRSLLGFAEMLGRAPIATAEQAAGIDPTSWTVAGDDRVDVVIPVYGDTEATLDCIASVRRSANRTPIEIVVIDDATPEPGLARALDELAGQGAITLLRNEQNHGFPATANRGMALHPARDVILLNADTRVQGNWVDRLRAAAHADWNVATATPFSNNAEICSYPEACQAAPYPGVREQERIDDTLARVNAGRTLTIPTAVGFCMYLRRDALRQVAPFDAMRFQRGYGEENDLCMRMRARGLRHVLAADVYVAHAGGASFGAEKQALVEQGLQRLTELHPGYLAEVAEFIAEDPMKSLRVRAHAALLPGSGEASMLFVTHDRGGGTERHVEALAAQLEREGVRVLLLSPEASGEVRLQVHGEAHSPNLRFDVTRELEDLVDALRLAGVAHVHFHHLIGLPNAVARIASRLGVGYDVTAHDYFSICPRVHLIDDSGVYCGEPAADACTACVARNGSPVGYDVDVARWRARSAELLAGARRVFVPSEDTRARLARYFEDVHWVVRPHAEAPWTEPSAAARPGRTPRRVAVIGAIGYHKGSGVLLACARDAAERKLPLSFAVIGYTDRNEELLATGRVTLTGPYEEADLNTLLRRARCQLAFLPSVWPETYCYALSGAMRAQLHPVVFDIGAPADRVRASGYGDLLPLSLSASEINDRLLQTRPGAFPRDRVEAAHVGAYASCLKDYYERLDLG